MLNYTLYILYEMNSQLQPLVIYVTHAANISYADFIKSALLKTFNNDALQFCDTPDQAQLIISNTYEGETAEKIIFHFENVFDQKQWKNLINFISDYIYSNVFD
jgi:PPE-repeat protein